MQPNRIINSQQFKTTLKYPAATRKARKQMKYTKISNLCILRFFVLFYVQSFDTKEVHTCTKNYPPYIPTLQDFSSVLIRSGLQA